MFRETSIEQTVSVLVNPIWDNWWNFSPAVSYAEYITTKFTTFALAASSHPLKLLTKVLIFLFDFKYDRIWYIRPYMVYTGSYR